MPQLPAIKPPFASLSEFAQASIQYYCTFTETAGWRVHSKGDLIEIHPRVSSIKGTPVLVIPGIKSNLRAGHFLKPSVVCLFFFHCKNTLLNLKAPNVI